MLLQKHIPEEWGQHNSSAQHGQLHLQTNKFGNMAGRFASPGSIVVWCTHPDSATMNRLLIQTMAAFLFFLSPLLLCLPVSDHLALFPGASGVNNGLFGPSHPQLARTASTIKIPALHTPCATKTRTLRYSAGHLRLEGLTKVKYGASMEQEECKQNELGARG